jgi:hypothetical protein
MPLSRASCHSGDGSSAGNTAHSAYRGASSRREKKKEEVQEMAQHAAPAGTRHSAAAEIAQSLARNIDSGRWGWGAPHPVSGGSGLLPDSRLFLKLIIAVAEQDATRHRLPNSRSVFFLVKGCCLVVSSDLLSRA